MSHTDVFALYEVLCWGPIFVIFLSRWLKYANITLLKVYSQLISVWTLALEAIKMSHTVNSIKIFLSVCDIEIGYPHDFETNTWLLVHGNV